MGRSNRVFQLAALGLASVLCDLAVAAAPATEAPAFVNSAIQAGMMEMEAAKLAMNVSTDDAVKTFAARMIADQERANGELIAIATTKRIPIPSMLDLEHTKLLESLRGKSGKAFDTAYATHMVNDHAKEVELFQANVSHPDGELAAFAGKSLPVAQEHKRLAENLAANGKAAVAGK